jgi:hypothetical protein
MTDRDRPGNASGPDGTPAPGTPRASGQAPAGSRGERTTRTGRRDHDRVAPPPRSFLERYRTALVVVAGIAIAGILAGFLLVQTTAKAYACGSILAPTASNDPAALGQAASDLGRTHVLRGTSVRYGYCPPTSGEHYNDLPDGPIPALFYEKDRATLPQGWVHNLEHGGVVVLYSCTKGTCSDADLAPLRSYVHSNPPSPLCAQADALLGTRFDDLPTPYAVVAWDRALFLETADVEAITAFYAQRGDRGPEPQCAEAVPGASASPSAPAPSSSAAP